MFLSAETASASAAGRAFAPALKGEVAEQIRVCTRHQLASSSARTWLLSAKRSRSLRRSPGSRSHHSRVCTATAITSAYSSKAASARGSPLRASAVTSIAERFGLAKRGRARRAKLRPER